MAGRWRALVSNGTFMEVLPDHRERMTSMGFDLVDTGGGVGNLTAAQVRELGKEADAIFGPSAGLDAALFAASKRLKIVALAASGYESVDINAATQAGIVITNAPTPAGSEAVADLAFGLMLAVARDIPNRHNRIVNERKSDRTMGRAVFGRTLGIVGLGHIGKAVARRGRGFGMRVLAYELDAFWDAAFAAEQQVERASLETLLREGDYVSLHLRLTDANKGCIGAKELAWMKPTAFLINSARGPLVDEQALYDALVNRRIAGAGLDTILDGGHNSPLIGLPNVVGTPHIGNRVIESVHDVVDAAIDDALAVLQGQRPKYLVNPQVYETGLRQ